MTKGYRCIEHLNSDLDPGGKIRLASGYTGEGVFIETGHKCQHEDCNRIAKYWIGEIT